MKNQFGQILRMSSYGESHGRSVGVLIDGLPAGLAIDLTQIEHQLRRRRPGKHDAKENIQSDRKEADALQVASGIYEGKSLGTPILLYVENQDTRSQDYEQIKHQPRAGHADDSWLKKFGHRDHRGGGRASARETVARVMAGGVAEQLLQQAWPQYRAFVYVAQIGPHRLSFAEHQKLFAFSGSTRDFQDFLDQQGARFPSEDGGQSVFELLKTAKQQGHSYGGKIAGYIQNVPAGLGQPVFHKLKADLAAAMLSIPASQSFSLGDSETGQSSEGSVLHSHQDPYSQIYGGIRGGISTGDAIYFEVGFKPTSSVLGVAKQGRHDPCILPRAVVVVEAMLHWVLADHLLWQRSDRL